MSHLKSLFFIDRKCILGVFVPLLLVSFTAPFCVSNSKFRHDLDVATKNQCVNYARWIIALDFVSQAIKKTVLLRL